MKLVEIPTNKYQDYRLDIMFECYKWDPQYYDNNTVARYALVITEEEHRELGAMTEALDKETRVAEELINKHQEITKHLRLTRKLKPYIRLMKNYNTETHIRLTRYDFHPTTVGWAISEVNSDVPGGFAEASLMPRVAIDYLGNPSYHFVSFVDKLVEALERKLSEKTGKRRIMLIHCTSYSDDRQVMQFLGDRLQKEGYEVIYGAGEHINFEDGRAYSILDGNEGAVDAIFRFTPLEWLADIKPRRWQGYFNTQTLSCNHPVAIYAQTKRFPFVWDKLEKYGVDMFTWKRLLPETVEVKTLKNYRSRYGASYGEDYIYKPAYGRVGDGITIKEAISHSEYVKILKDVKRHPNSFVAQKRFNSIPVEAPNGFKFHVCLGAYAVDGNAAGYYARISSTPRIDSSAADIPVLIEGKVHSYDS